MNTSEGARKLCEILADHIPKITMGQIARRVGVYRSSVLRWAKRGAVPQQRIRVRLSEHYDIDVSAWDQYQTEKQRSVEQSTVRTISE